MKKQLFFALVLLCAGISLNAMSTDMENQKEEIRKEEVAPVVPAPVKEEAVAPVKDEAAPAEADFEIDMDMSDVEEEA